MKEKGGGRPLRTEEFARRIGVSRMTVSRVLNNSSLVAEKTRERVLQAMKELNFQPHALAQSLARRRVYTFAFIFLFPAQFRFPIEVIYTDPFNQGVMSGVLDAARRHGYSTLVWVEEQVDNLPSLLNSGLVAGAAIAVGRDDEATHRKLWEVIGRSSVPLVFPGYRSPLPAAEGRAGMFLEGYDFEGAVMATRYLLEKGHRRIAHVGGEPASHRSRERWRGYMAALREAGIEPESAWVVAGPHTEMDGERLVHQIFDQARVPPTAVFAAGDRAAIGCVKGLQARGLRVPHDVAVVGFDDIEVARHVSPPLTTVAYPYFHLGFRAGLALLAHEGVVDGVEPDGGAGPRLVVRASA